MIRIKCLCVSAVLVALASVVVAFASPASAAPMPPPEYITCSGFTESEVFDPTVDVCQGALIAEGLGEDLHLVLANQCYGPMLCFKDVTLLGTFDRVVIERANECANQAICRIAVDVQAEVNQLRIQDKTISAFGTRFKNRCDPTATCVKTP